MEETKNTNIVLLLSHKVGAWVAEYFASRDLEKVVAIYFEEKSDYSNNIIKTLKLNDKKVFYGKYILTDLSHIKWLITQDIDFILTVYWPWLLEEKFFKTAKQSINFHPAYLPINRGWYPHVHSIIDGSKAGVTLHQISKGPDEGDIWVQKEIKVKKNETASDVYKNLELEIFSLFSKNWDLIKSDSLLPIKQNHSISSYHKKSDLLELDNINLENLSAIQLFNLLRARSFGNKGFSYINHDGKKYYLNLRVGSSVDFD